MVVGSNPTGGAVFELRSFQPGDLETGWQLHDAALEDAGAHGGRGAWEDDLRDIRAAYFVDFAKSLGTTPTGHSRSGPHR
jgi:hypothetical protein